MIFCSARWFKQREKAPLSQPEPLPARLLAPT
jgi:hypothetical protein